MKEEKEVKRELTKSGQMAETDKEIRKKEPRKEKIKQEKEPEPDLLPVTWASADPAGEKRGDPYNRPAVYQDD